MIVHIAGVPAGGKMEKLNQIHAVFVMVQGDKEHGKHLKLFVLINGVNLNRRTEMQEYEKGHLVYIVNQTMMGKYFIEGKAEIVKTVDAKDSRYLVKYLGDKQLYERFVDYKAQHNPEGFCQEMNGE